MNFSKHFKKWGGLKRKCVMNGFLEVDCDKKKLFPELCYTKKT